VLATSVKSGTKECEGFPCKKKEGPKRGEGNKGGGGEKKKDAEESKAREGRGDTWFEQGNQRTKRAGGFDVRKTTVRWGKKNRGPLKLSGKRRTKEGTERSKEKGEVGGKRKGRNPKKKSLFTPIKRKGGPIGG